MMDSPSPPIRAPATPEFPPANRAPDNVSIPTPTVSRDPVVELTTYYNQKMNELTSERDFLKSKVESLESDKRTLRRGVSYWADRAECGEEKRKALEDELEELKKKKFKFSFEAKIKDAE